MKKLTLIVSAFALLIGFSQCRKEVINPNTNDQGVHITLNAGYGQNGQRTDFDPAGSFVWTNDAPEYVYVGGSNHDACLGVLSGTGNGEVIMTFTGGLTTPPDYGELLYFFYLGKGRDGGPVNTLDFSSQDGTLANVTNYHIAIGSATYNGTSNYSATLNMAMAIAYFDLSGFNNDSKAAETVYLSGNDVYSTATINYKEGTIIGDAKGNINLGTSGSKYVALIPSVNTETMLRFESDSKIGGMTFLRGIQAGKFYSSDNHNALAVTANSCLFSVAANKKVKFSRGNLQYQASTGTWRFAEHQYDFVGNAAGNTTAAANRPTQSAWIDLFGWGTSGYNGKYPYMSSGTGSDYVHGSDIANTDYDWGVYNSANITNGSGYTTWHTSTSTEWTYLLNTRTTSTSNLPSGTNSSNARYTKAQVNSVNGLIIFPDSYNHPSGTSITTSSNKYNDGSKRYDSFIVTRDDWSKMESVGAIFLPEAGSRNGTGITTAVCRYWTSSYHEDYFNSNTNITVYKPYSLYVSNSLLTIPYSTNYGALNYYGSSVRLVRVVE